jgi:hypothetical protein
MVEAVWGSPSSWAYSDVFGQRHYLTFVYTTRSHSAAKGEGLRLRIDGNEATCGFD